MQLNLQGTQAGTHLRSDVCFGSLWITAAVRSSVWPATAASDVMAVVHPMCGNVLPCPCSDAAKTAAGPLPAALRLMQNATASMNLFDVHNSSRHPRLLTLVRRRKASYIKSPPHQGLDLTLVPFRFLRPCSSWSPDTVAAGAATLVGAATAAPAGAAGSCCRQHHHACHSQPCTMQFTLQKLICATRVAVPRRVAHHARVQPAQLHMCTCGWSRGKSLSGDHAQERTSPPVTSSVRLMCSSRPSPEVPGGGRCASCPAPTCRQVHKTGVKGVTDALRLHDRSL